MQIPPDKNTRAEAMWRIISQRVDFRGKRVIDLGCGTGDFLWRVYVAGARFIVGVEQENSDRLRNMLDICSIVLDDINRHKIKFTKPFDIALCFSVLPYLNDVSATLKWMSSNFSLCLIECQYAGDGPGLRNIGADKGMMQLLFSNGFASAEAIGKTRIEGREYQGKQIYRTIWLCETKES